MEIKYQLGTADFFAWYEHLQAKQKGRSREDYYRQTLWYLGVLALAIYVSAKHEEHFVVSILLALVLFYLWQNWSFEKSWRMAAEQYSNLVPASTGTLSIDGHGLTSTGDGVTTRLNWDAVEAVETTSDHVFVRYRKSEAMLIPLRCVEGHYRTKLLELLERRGKAPAAGDTAGTPAA